MTESAADSHRVHAFGDQLAGVKMPEGVQPDVWQLQFHDITVLLARRLARATQAAVPAREDEIIITGAAKTKFEALFPLPGPMFSQAPDH